MNMISTGAFLSEVDSSSKQTTLAEKFVAVWKRKILRLHHSSSLSLRHAEVMMQQPLHRY